MKRLNRVTKNEEFSKIVSLRKSFANDSFVVYCSTKAYEGARIGISVSKKIGNAVVRNKIKRQIRMMIRDTIDFNEFPKDLIIVARNKYLNYSYKENKEYLEKLVKKAII